MSELKPCPFCGGVPEIVTRDVEPQGDPWYGGKRETFVLCDCGACLFDGAFHEGFWDAETRAVAAWNLRAGITRKPLTLEQMQELVEEFTWFDSEHERYDIQGFARAVERFHGITPQSGKESGE